LYLYHDQLLILVAERSQSHLLDLYLNFNIMSIYSIISDLTIQSDLSNCFKNRTLEQKFLYQ